MRWSIFGSVPFNWRCGVSLPECARAATMFRGLTSSGGSQEAGRTFSASTALWPTESVKAKTRTKARRPLSFAAGVGRALRRAAKDAQKTARMYGTPLYVWENGKVVAKKP